MAFLYKPTIKIASVEYFLPQPIRQWSVRAQTRIRSTEIPLRAGSVVGSAVRGSMLIDIQGLISKSSHDSVLEEFMDLQDLLLSTVQPFDLYRYYDTINENYIWYDECVCQNLSFDFTHQTVLHLPYSFSVLVPNGLTRVHTTP